MFENWASNWGVHNKRVGWFSPSYKLLLPSYNRILKMIRPAVKSASKIDGVIELVTGGAIEFWTLNDPDAGRSRFYDEVLIDEASLAKGLRDIWEQSIAPTLLDRGGNCSMAGTPKGINDEDYFYQACTDKNLLDEWKEFHAPTSANPMLDPVAVSKLQEKYPPLVYKQEYLAEFVNWSGEAFFSSESLTVNGRGVPLPMHCDAVYCVIDSALKDGSENDGTGVTWFGLTKGFGIPLVVLDWEITQINSDLLIAWLPGVLRRGEQLAAMCECRGGFIGAFIEDKASGITLNQYAQRVGLPCQPIDGDITSIGKDGRAINASGPVHRGEVKISALAYDKVTEYKKQTRNHLTHQVCGYRLGDKDAAKRADDLFDTFTYGVIIGLNGPDGF
ncbi:MAG: hypothetical protein V4447_10735 [Pseudomonadota bacterium]